MAGGATAVFQAAVSEKLTAEHTGHRSHQSLQPYERKKTNYDDNFVSAAITGAGGASAQFQSSR